MTGDRKSSAYSNYGAEVLKNRGDAESSNGDTTVFFAYSKQKWNDKWSTFQRYLTADVSVTGADDTKNYTFGVAYQYNPAVKFELVYDKIDYGQGGNKTGDDNLVRFRTHVVF
jgi:phosphate-selective porin